MHYLLVDTCVWLDIAADPAQQKLLRLIEQLIELDVIRLLFPETAIDELNKNKERVVNAHSKSLSALIKRTKEMVEMLGPEKTKGLVMDHLNDVNYQIPGLRHTALGSISLIEQIIKTSRKIQLTDGIKLRASERAIRNLAPFHLNKNSFNDALIIESFAEELKKSKAVDYYVFVTHNTSDFSKPQASHKESHPDFDNIFISSNIRYSINLEETIRGIQPELVEELLMDMEGWEDKPREFNEIIVAENEFFDRVWYHRHRMRYWNNSFYREQSPAARKSETAQKKGEGSYKPAKRIEKKYGKKSLWPIDDFELGMINGKLSALRWVLGEEWDFLDT